MCFGGGRGGVVIPGMLRVKVHRSDYRKETTGRRKKTLRGNRHQTAAWFSDCGNSVKYSKFSDSVSYLIQNLIQFLFFLEGHTILFCFCFYLNYFHVDFVTDKKNS